jgi:ribonuclease HI
VNSSKELVKNVGVIRYISALLDLRAKSGQKVRLQYVKGHSGNTGNDGADAQANQGTTQPPRGELDWAAMEKELRKKIELDWRAEKVEDAVPIEVVFLEDKATANKVLPRVRRRTGSPRRAETPSPQKKQANSRELEATLKSPVQFCPLSSHAPQATEIKQDITARLSPLKAPLRASAVAPPVPVNKEDFDLDRRTMSLHADETSSPKKKEASFHRYLQMEAALKSPPHPRSLSSHALLAAQIKQGDAAMKPPSVAPVRAPSVTSPLAPVEKGGFDPDRRTRSPRPVEISSSQKKPASLHRIPEMEALKSPVQSRPLSPHAPQATQIKQDDVTKLPQSMATLRSSSVVSPLVSVNKEDLDLDVSSLLPSRFCDCLHKLLLDV